ncbi:UNVERIFIED_CONTAM: hypothetical protein PYX00_004301 [Menopon gallinae]|uniref:Uncharacterized protein n=1 Tax=Menopon gallinae TaxID=328185 RepID=A0AAW2I436_9NEOP
MNGWKGCLRKGAEDDKRAGGMSEMDAPKGRTAENLPLDRMLTSIVTTPPSGPILQKSGKPKTEKGLQKE